MRKNKWKISYLKLFTTSENEDGMNISKFDIADYLDSNEMIAEYLNTVLEEGNNADIITAIGYIEKAVGVDKNWIKGFIAIPDEYRCNPFDISPSGDLFWADSRNVEIS